MQLVTSEEEKRTEVDEDIYLSENRFEKPKEIFKSICSIVKNHNFSEQMNICDIGCSTGEFLYYFKTLFPKCSVTGLDISKSMLQVAKKMMPDGKFLEGNVNSEQLFSKNSFDVVTMTGTLSIFDDPRPSIVNCLSAIKKNGLVIISGIFNPNPVDVIVRYRNADSTERDLKPGWNVHSCYTIEKIIKEIEPQAKLCWHDFKMPFEIKQTSDPMRTWTVKIDNNISLINGASQICDMKILEIIL